MRSSWVSTKFSVRCDEQIPCKLFTQLKQQRQTKCISCYCNNIYSKSYLTLTTCIPHLGSLSTGYNDASCDLPLVVCLTQVIKSNQLSTDASDVWQTIYDLRTCPLTLHPSPCTPVYTPLPCPFAAPLSLGRSLSGASSSLACAIFIVQS